LCERLSYAGHTISFEVRMIPTTLLQVAIFVVFVAPGITYASVRVALVGVRAADLGAASRILEALTVGVLFDALYVLVFFQFVRGAMQSPSVALTQFQWWQALVAVVLLLVVPAGVGYLTGQLKWWPWYGTIGYRPTPLAWDFKALNMPNGQFVRVRTDGGVYYGGWYSRESYMSTYPHPRDIYIETQWTIDSHGVFGVPITDAGGMWLRITDTCVVDWIKASEAPQQKEETTDGK
jgi:hypothetical protein